MTNDLRGLLTALVTPFTKDDEVDAGLLKKVVDFSVDGGVNGVVACGSTGEVGALTTDERLEVVETVVEACAGRVPVIAQTGATSTKVAKQLTTAAEKAGADVVMLVTPYYEPLSVEETVTYIKDVASSVQIPVMLYNIPACTGVNLTPDLVRELASSVENIRYIKDSSANYEQNLELIHHHRDVIGTFIGWDAYTFSGLAEGCAGMMCGAANVVPSELAEVYTKVSSGDLKGGLEAWNKVYPVIDVLLTSPFFAACKAGIAMRGVPVGDPRPPASALDEVNLARLKRALAQLG